MKYVLPIYLSEADWAARAPVEEPRATLDDAIAAAARSG